MNDRQPAAPPDPILDRFWKLVRLATNNPSAEEARTAAMKAIQFLIEHKLSVSSQAPPAPQVVNPTPQSPFDFSDLFHAQARGQAEAAQWDARMRETQRRWRYDQQTDSYVDPDTYDRRRSPFR